MQPATEQTTKTATEHRRLRGDEGELYARHHHDLYNAVARNVYAQRELIEDACQNAWTKLLRVQPDRASVGAWLYVVAVREAYRLCACERRHLHLEAISPAGSWEAITGDHHSIDDILAAHDALQILASLPQRQRTDLTLLVAGYSYTEIAKITGGRTYTNVNKHIAKARTRVRLARTSEAA